VKSAPKHRRRPNLSCSFTPTEVRALDDLLTGLLALEGHADDLVAMGELVDDLRTEIRGDRKKLESMALKFARMRLKTKGMGL
jgi:hypothetical protein